MTPRADFAKTLMVWYTQHLRPFLIDAASDRVQQLDVELTRLDELCEMLEAEMPVCFLGTAGVGKSTLINAVVARDDVILPAGGVGPLTAEATLVRYSSECRFLVTYHSPSKLNRLLFALERSHERNLQLTVNGTIAPANDVEASLSAEEKHEAELLTEVPAEPSDGRPSQIPDLLGALARQGAQLVRGDQYAALDRGYLLDRLRECLGAPLHWGTVATDEDAGRIERIREVLERARRGDGLFEVNARSAELEFRRELEQHAAGHLAPLVRRIEVGWDAELLRSGVVLIDLPGLGVANDEFRNIAYFA